MSGLPTECSDVRSGRNTGSSSRRESDDDGVPILLGGVTTAQGAEESSVQGEGAQVAILDGKGLAGREMHKTCLIPNVQRSATGEPDASKEARPVLRRAERKGPVMVPRSRPILLYWAYLETHV